LPAPKPAVFGYLEFSPDGPEPATPLFELEKSPFDNTYKLITHLKYSPRRAKMAEKN
jgi:hypothetical protein